MYYGSLPRTRPSPCENTPIGETAILAGPLKSKCHRHRGRPDRPYCGELVQRDPIRFPIWQTDGNMSLAFVQMLYNVTCHDWGWETTPKGQDYGTRYDRNILIMHLFPPKRGSHIGKKRQCRSAHRKSQHRRRTHREVYVKRAHLVSYHSGSFGRCANDGV